MYLNTLNFRKTINVDNIQIAEPIALNAWSIGRTIFIELTDGRNISFPADRFKILSKADDEQLKEVSVRLNGYALR